MTAAGDLTTREAAILLGVHTRTITTYADSGRLPHSKLPSGHRRFKRVDVEALRDRGATGDGLVPIWCADRDHGLIVFALPGSRAYCARCKSWFVSEPAPEPAA